MPNLLASPRGRLAAFFLLYVTEGIPIGFAATAMATQMRRMGLGPAEIGAFVGALYLPWAFKWIAGPLVDVLKSRRWGPRRAWILAMQVAMIVTLAAAASLDPVAQIGLVTTLILLHNSCAAVQDVAIDALAVGSLDPSERGRAAGLMFAGAYVGQAIGGAGALAVSATLGYAASVAFVCGALALVTLGVVWPMREAAHRYEPVSGHRKAEGASGVSPNGPAQDKTDGGAEGGPEGGADRLGLILRRLREFLMTTWETLRSSQAARLGFLVAVMPMGCLSLGLALKTNLGVDLGLADGTLAGLSLATTVLGATGCLVGGALADRWDRRRTLTLAIVGMAMPVLALAAALVTWGTPGGPAAPAGAGATALDPRVPMAYLIACSVYSLFNGMMYGSAMALFMDITRAAVAATQFTAYTALMNLAITLSARWQGWAIERWGYPTTLLADVAVGFTVLAVLPFLRPSDSGRPEADRG